LNCLWILLELAVQGRESQSVYPWRPKTFTGFSLFRINGRHLGTFNLFL